MKGGFDRTDFFRKCETSFDKRTGYDRAPVSYTHLTEYEVISQPTFFKDLYVDVELSEKDLAEIYTPEAVSYTHLDVYKRQLQKNL